MLHQLILTYLPFCQISVYTYVCFQCREQRAGSFFGMIGFMFQNFEIQSLYYTGL